MGRLEDLEAEVRYLRRRLDNIGSGGGGGRDHGTLTGLADDDHTHYLLADGTRAMTGGLDLGSNAITNVGNVDGRDVSADGTKLDGIEAGAEVNDVTSVFGRTGAVTAVQTDYAIYSDSTQGMAPGPTGLAVGSTSYYLTAAGTWKIPPQNTDAGNLITGVLLDARVQQSNVTQHEAAIDHDALTNFDALEHVKQRYWGGGMNNTAHSVSTLADVPMQVEDETSGTSDFSLASNELTIKVAGKYALVATAVIKKTTSNANCNVELILYQDSGGGYTTGARDMASGHVRVVNQTSSMTVCRIIDAVTDHKVKFQARDTLSGGNVEIQGKGLIVAVYTI